MYIGVGPKFDNMNKDNYYEGYFLDPSNGQFTVPHRTSYAHKVNAGSIIGVLIDMFRGNLKFFIDDVDQGWALENNSKI